MDDSIDIAKFFDEESYSDVTIKIPGKDIRAHRMILCEKSEYFKRALGPHSTFKVRHMFESLVNAILISTRRASLASSNSRTTTRRLSKK